MLGKVSIAIEAQLARFESDMGRAARITEKEMKRAAREAEEARRQMVRSMAGFAASIVSAGAAFAALRATIGRADEYANLAGRIALVVEGLDKQRATQDALFASAQRTRSSLSETTGLYVKLAQSSKELAADQDRLLRITELINQALVVSSSTPQQAASAIQQFGQAIAGGVLRGEEFNSVNENGNRIITALADGLGKSAGELRKMAEAGKLTADVVLTALESQAGKVSAEFAKMPNTVGGAMQQVENALLQVIGRADQTTQSSRALANEISDLARTLSSPETQQAFSSIVQGVVSITQAIAEAIPHIVDWTNKLNHGLGLTANADGLYKGNAIDFVVGLGGEARGLYEEAAGTVTRDSARALGGRWMRAQGTERAWAGLTGRYYDRDWSDTGPDGKPMNSPGIGWLSPRLENTLDGKGGGFSLIQPRGVPYTTEPAGTTPKAKPTGTGTGTGTGKGAGGAKGGNEARAIESYIAQLDRQLGLMGATTQEEQTLFEIRSGSLRAASKGQQALALEKARGIDLAKAEQDQYQNSLRLAEEELRVRQQQEQHLASFMADLQFETDLVGKSNAEREVMIALRQAGVSAMSAEGQAIRQQIEELQRLQEAEMVVMEVKGAATDMFASFLDGSQSAGDAFEDFTKRLRRLAAQMLAEKAIQYLFNAFAGGGGQGSGFMGWASGNPLSGGWSSGGYTGAGGVNQPAGVVHKGEVVWSQRDVARAGGVGVVEAMRLGTRGYADGGVVGAVASGGGNVTVVVENHSGAPARTEEGTDADGGKLIKVIVDAAVAAVDQRIGTMGSTGRAIQGRFGLSPAGASRG